MTMTKVICVAVASCFLAGPAFAIAPHDDAKQAPSASTAKSGSASLTENEKTFREFDRNSDGYVSKDEVSSSKALAEGFEAADKDHDGKLDPAEFQALEADASSDRSLASTVIEPR